MPYWLNTLITFASGCIMGYSFHAFKVSNWIRKNMNSIESVEALRVLRKINNL